MGAHRISSTKGLGKRKARAYNEVWGQSPQRGHGAHRLVRESGGGEVIPEVKIFEAFCK